MSKRYLVFSIICWVIMLITMVCWIVTYYGLFSMNLQQSMWYIGFYRIEIYNGWYVSDIVTQLSQSFERVLSSEMVHPEYLLSYFNFGAFDNQQYCLPRKRKLNNIASVYLSDTKGRYRICLKDILY